MNTSDIEAMLDSMKCSIIENDGESDEFCGMTTPPKETYPNGECYFALVKRFDNLDNANKWLGKVSKIEDKK